MRGARKAQFEVYTNTETAPSPEMAGGPGGPPFASAALHSPPGRPGPRLRCRQRAPLTPELFLPPRAARAEAPPHCLSPARKGHSSLWWKRTTIHTTPFRREAAQPAARLLSVFRAVAGGGPGARPHPAPRPLRFRVPATLASLSSARAFRAPTPAPVLEAAPSRPRPYLPG